MGRVLLGRSRSSAVRLWFALLGRVRSIDGGEDDRGKKGAFSAPPFPPNRTGGSPASGSPVDGLPQSGVMNVCPVLCGEHHSSVVS
jgi:hypothetical protein